MKSDNTGESKKTEVMERNHKAVSKREKKKINTESHIDALN